MDLVFRALADPTRRSLLDELFRQDGQTLSTLEQRLPMTRFGVMKEIEPIEDSCRLTVTHDQLCDDAPAELCGGWPMILSGLKTLLETGETLTTPGSLRYSRPAAERLTTLRSSS